MIKKNNVNNKVSELTIDHSSEDSSLQFSLSGVSKFKIGIDDSDSDKFKISSGSALGTNDTFVVHSTGEVTSPLTSSFSAYALAQSNVTGTSVTIYTVKFEGGEYFDLNNDFDGTSTFTAPVSGRYIFTTNINLGGLLSTHRYGYLDIKTSNLTRPRYFQPFNMSRYGSSLTISYSYIFDMDAADTAQVQIRVRYDGTSSGSQTVDINAGACSVFSGALIC